MKQIKNVAYIHDLGGTKTEDGRIIKHGQLFRSSHLALIEEKGLDYLVNDVKLKNVIDLRTDDEIKYQPEDFISPRINYHHISLVTNENNPAVTRTNRVEILNQLVALPGGMRGHILDLYKIIVDSDLAKEGYRKIFKLLLDHPKESFDIHCTQGKDRTGLTIYLILSALGVKEETIYNIYLSFNRRARVKRIIYFLGMNIRFTFKKAVALNDTLTAKRMYLKEAIDVIKNKYSGVINYLKTEIGIDEDKINTLKSIYLQ